METMDERIDKWLDELEEANALKRFLVAGIQVLFCLVLVGILVSKAYVYDAVYFLIIVGYLPNGGIPVFVVDVIRCVVAIILCSWIMLMFLVRLETTWFRLM